MSITESTRKASYKKTKRTLNVRQAQVIKVLSINGTMTAQEVATALHRQGLVSSADRNHAAPRLTELCRMGLVVADGKKFCPKTNRNVSLWRLNRKEERST